MDSSWPIERQPRPAREPLRLLLGPTEEPSQEPSGYVLFVAGPTGFSIVECNDEPPSPDQLLLLDGGAYRIVSVRRSPLPGDRRPCLVLEPQQ
jgi:hypothetical protein